MSKYAKVLIGIIITTIIIIIVDIILLVKDMPTISKTILYYTFNKKIVIAPMLIGVLCGHFFIPHSIKLIKKDYLIPVILISLILVLQLLNLIITIHPIIYVLIGTICGTLFWNQKRIK